MACAKDLPLRLPLTSFTHFASLANYVPAEGATISNSHDKVYQSEESSLAISDSEGR